MSILNKFTLKSQLTSLLLGVSLSSLLVAGIFSYLQFKKGIQNQVSERLTGIKSAKKSEIELYMQDLRSHIEILSEDRMIVSGMVEFNSAYEALKGKVIPADWSESIEDYYQTKFLPRLSDNIQGEQLLVNYNPTSQVSQYLQYHYIAHNSYSVGEKYKLVNARDGSKYSEFHGKYHPFFSSLQQKFGYYDLFLVSFQNEEIVYSVAKETDYATSLEKGSYRRSGLAKAVTAVKENPGKGFVQIIDFKPYAPSYGAPAAFLAAPIYNGPHLIGILAVQLPIDRIDLILSGNNNWEEEGLGKTGQVYTVGSDLLMRSDARLLLEDEQKYFQQLPQSNLSEQSINLIKKLKTSILLQSVNTKAAKSALDGLSGKEIINNYQGTPVISAYAPLNIEGLDWGIIAEINQSEAFRPIYTFQIYFSILSVILLLLISWLAGLLSQNFVHPIQKLTSVVGKLKSGENVTVELNRQDELGELATVVNDVASQINTQQKTLALKDQENTTLLANNLPSKAIAPWQQGQKQITDTLIKVTILYGSIVGLNQLSPGKSATEISSILNQLIINCDRYTTQYGLEKHNTIWSDYVAVCGLSQNYLDQSQRALNVALKMIETISQINHQYQVDLGWRIAIHSGKLTAGVIGQEKFAYKLWGETVDIVTNLNTRGAINSIVITKEVKERLSDQYSFIDAEELALDHLPKTATWTLNYNGAHSAQAHSNLSLNKP